MSDPREALGAIGELPDTEIDIADAALHLARVDAPDADWHAARDHLSNKIRAGIGPAYLVFGWDHIADIRKALGAQQFLKNLRRDAGDGVLLEPDGGDFRRWLRGERLDTAAETGCTNPADASGSG